MIHDHVRNPVELASSLMATLAVVPLLVDAAAAMAARVVVGPETHKIG